MRACHHLHPKGGAAGLQKAAGAAIGIDHEQAVIGSAVRCDGGLNSIRDPVRPQMQICRKALQIKMMPAVLAL